MASTVIFGRGTSVDNLGTVVTVNSASAAVRFNGFDDVVSLGSLVLQAGLLYVNNTLNVNGNTTISGGTAQVNNLLNLKGDVTMTGGTINGVGSTISASYHKWSGGSLSGATLQINNKLDITSTVFITSGHTIVNYGVVNITGTLSGSNAAKFQNNAAGTVSDNKSIYISISNLYIPLYSNVSSSLLFSSPFLLLDVPPKR